MNLSFLKKKNATVGIDIGSHSVKLVKLVHNQGGKSLVDFCDTIEIKSTDPAFQDTLKNYLHKHHLSGLDAAACLEDATFKIRKIELPKMPETDLREAVRFKMRDIMEGPVEEYVVRSSLLEEIGSKAAPRMLLVGYAVKKVAVSHLMQILHKAGLRPTFIEPTVVSLASAVEEVHPSNDTWHAAIDLGAAKSLMVIIGHGKFYFSRPLMGIQLVGESTDESSYNQKLAAEIQHTLDTFAVTFQVEQINRLLLSGGGAGIPGIVEYLATNLGLQCEAFNPFSSLQMNPETAKAIAGRTHLFTQAVSLANLKTTS